MTKVVKIERKSRRSLKGRGNPLSEIDRQLQMLNKSLDYIPAFSQKLKTNKLKLTPSELEILQVNVGYMCNLTCEHCHVDAGPDRKEIMDKATMEHCLRVIDQSDVKTIDITGGAPEMNPHFLWFIEELSKRKLEIIVRSNLTILLSNKKYYSYPEYFKKFGVTVIASLPCYTAENLEKQRGDGVFAKSIEALQILNKLGYGKANTGMKLHLVYNPVGASLPPSQEGLQADYKRVLLKDFGIEFNDLYCITNIPISRFLEFLDKSGKLEDYMTLLANSFNHAAIDGLMCRNTLSVKWDGSLYDCDFNQMLDMKLDKKAGTDIRTFNPSTYADRSIAMHQHCYGCTAGAGSSCQGTTI